MKFVEGNITDAKGMIAHGCNAQGVYNAGVARDIRQKWPLAYKEYEKSSKIVGTISWSYDYQDRDGVIIFNCITQNHYGRSGKYARYLDVIDCLSEVCVHASEYKQKINIPKIGCGLGGLNWVILQELLLELEERRGIEFIVWERK